MKQNESGRTLVEVMGVLAIIGMMTVGIMSSLQFGMKSFRVASLHSEVESIADGVADLYSWSRQYPASGNTVAKFGILVPPNGVCEEYDCETSEDNVVAKTPWGDEGLTISEGDPSYFVITLTGIPQDVCNRLQEQNWQNVEWESPVTCAEGDNTITFNAY